MSMTHKMRDQPEVERLLKHLDIMLHEPIPAEVPPGMIERVEFVRHCVWWILQDARGADFGHLVQMFDAVSARIRSGLRN